MRICYCFPKDVLNEIFFVEAAGRNILKDFFLYGDSSFKVLSILFTVTAFCVFSVFPHFISQMFEKIAAGKPCLTNMSEL